MVSVVRHLFAIIKKSDPQIVFLKRNKKVSRNSITRTEEVPDRVEDFERDFAYWVQENEKFVKFRILVASSVPQYKLFKTTRYGVLEKFKELGWYSTKLAITRQGNFAHVGWFKNLHPVFTNHDELLGEFKDIYGHITDEIDITSKTSINQQTE